MYFENVISHAKRPQPLVYKQTASFQIARYSPELEKYADISEILDVA